MGIINKIKYLIEKYSRNHHQKITMRDETKEIIQDAIGESFEVSSFEGGQCEYLSCTAQATISIMEKHLCPKHAKKFMNWYVGHFEK